MDNSETAFDRIGENNVIVNGALLDNIISENKELKTIVSKQIEVLNFLKQNILNGKIPSGDIGLMEMIGFSKSLMQLINKYKKNPEVYAQQMQNVTYIAEAGAKYLSFDQIKSLQ